MILDHFANILARVKSVAAAVQDTFVLVVQVAQNPWTVSPAMYVLLDFIVRKDFLIHLHVSQGRILILQGQLSVPTVLKVTTVTIQSVPLLVLRVIIVQRVLEMISYLACLVHTIHKQEAQMYPIARIVHLVCTVNIMGQVQQLVIVLKDFIVLLELMYFNRMVHIWAQVVSVHQEHFARRDQVFLCRAWLELITIFPSKKSALFVQKVISAHQILQNFYHILAQLDTIVLMEQDLLLNSLVPVVLTTMTLKGQV